MVGCGGTASTTASMAGHGSVTPTFPVVARPTGVRLASSSTRVTVGRTVTFSGTGCRPPAVVQLLLGEESGGRALPGDDGSWSVTTMVNQSSVLGTVPVRAYCVLSSRTLRNWAYPPLGVHVTTDRTLSIAPGATVEAGRTVRIQPHGACPEQAGAGALVELSGNVGTETATDASGNWTASLLIPRGTRPGTYTLTAACIFFRQVLAYYRPVTVTVRPP